MQHLFVYQPEIFSESSFLCWKNARPNLLFAVLKPCYQASSFEYNKRQFEGHFLLGPKRSAKKMM